MRINRLKRGGNATKLSKYNIFVELDKGEILVFNGISGAMVKIDGDTYRDIQKINGSPEAVDHFSGRLNDSVNDFYRYGIIVEDELNELDLIRAKHNLSKNQNRACLKVLPTIGCNFNCSYCCVIGRHEACEKMSGETEQLVIEFACNFLTQYESMYLAWTGGEPLIAYDTVLRVTRAVREYTLAQGKKFSASLQTNGYLLNRERALELRDCGVNQVSVSFDGPPEIHDKRRFIKNGGGTFDRILNNVKNIVGMFDIFLLTYLDKGNSGSFLELLDIYRQQELTGKVAVICDGVQPYDWIEGSYLKCYTTEEFVDIQKKLWLEALKRGVDIQPYPSQPWEGNCSGVSSNTFHISPEGDLYKCRELVGDKKNAVCNLRDRKLWTNPNLIRWLSFDLLGGECEKCEILPLCMGGCPMNELTLSCRNSSTGNARMCSSLKVNIKEVLKYKYEYILRRENNESIKV